MQTTMKEENFTRPMRVRLGIKANRGLVAIQIKMAGIWLTSDKLWNDEAYRSNIPCARVRHHRPIDIRFRDVLLAVKNAIIKHQNGGNHYAPSAVAEGVRRALA